MREEIWTEKIFKDNAGYFLRITKKRRRSETLHLPKQKHVSVISTDQTLGTTHAPLRGSKFTLQKSQKEDSDSKTARSEAASWASRSASNCAVTAES